MATDVQEQTEQERHSVYRKVKALMADGRWRSGYEVARIVGGSDAAATARLRDMRKEGLNVPCDRFPDGVWRYQWVRP